MKHTRQELKEWQALPLGVKILMTQERIRNWVREYGEEGTCISFSGGKDSTVLLDIVRNRMGYKDIPAVFVDTGLEYPEIRDFVKSFDNVIILKPSLTFKEVIQKYGYPFISKEVSECVYGARKYLRKFIDGQTIPYQYWYERVTGTGRYQKKEIIPDVDQAALFEMTRGGTITNGENFVDYRSIAEAIMRGGKNISLTREHKTFSDGDEKDPYTLNARAAMLMGVYTTNWDQKKKGIIPDSRDRSIFSQEKYKFFLDAPFNISAECCKVMKKKPIHKFNHESGRHPMTAQMAEESRIRTQKWLQNGCNGFNLKEPISNPMAFWTEQDVLHYIKENNIQICSVYGEIVAEEKDQICGQMSLADYNLVEDERRLKTTGCKRTGCMFCGYGCHLEKPGEGRFELMKETHPKQYDYIMRPKEEGGLDYKNIIDWINEHGNLNIRY